MLVNMCVVGSDGVCVLPRSKCSKGDSVVLMTGISTIMSISVCVTIFVWWWGVLVLRSALRSKCSKGVFMVLMTGIFTVS